MAEKTEKPTAKRLRDARKKGEVHKSKELTSAATYLAMPGALLAGGNFAFTHLQALVEQALLAPSNTTNGTPWMASVQEFAAQALWIVLPFLAACALAGLLAGFAQTRGVFSLHPLIPDFKRINPGQGLENLFSSRQFFELAKLLIKVGVLGAVVWWVTKGALDPLARSVHLAPAAGGLVVLALIEKMLAAAAAVYGASAAIDYGHQYFEFMKKQRMSRDEIRREHRDMEGDPYMKARRRALAREWAAGKQPLPVARANVVLTNPTHVAVALFYAPDETDLPLVIAKGEGREAAAIRREALAHHVPLYEDRPLARRIYAQVPLGDFIAEDMIEPVAEVFRWLQRFQAPLASATTGPGSA